MKRLSLLSMFFCLFLVGAVYSQTDKTALANFGGIWELDATKSKVPDDIVIEDAVLTVEQTKKKLTFTLEFNRELRSRTPTPRDEENAALGRGIPASGGTTVFRLNKGEIVPETAPPGIPLLSPVTLQAEITSNGNLKLTEISKYDTQASALDFKSVEVWELLDNGNALKITRETETSRGSQTLEMYFTKKDSTNLSTVGSVGTYQGQVFTVQGDYSAAPKTGKEISGGVLNGKASTLVAPEYPPAARAVRATGAVNVQVLIDEEGKVVSATAISGHPLLKAASEKAARSSEFLPTKLEGVPVRVTGIIVYNFIP